MTSANAAFDFWKALKLSSQAKAVIAVPAIR
jgi:hypothetical protein